jgi:iron complex outermembrane receptor protein
MAGLLQRELRQQLRSRCFRRFPARPGQKTTLVLINGRRTAGYGFAQNLQDTFVDLNSIPTSAVERVEILKDGASAIYGSDAIAGVVNVILRKDFRGAEVGVPRAATPRASTTARQRHPGLRRPVARTATTSSACSTTSSATSCSSPTPSTCTTRDLRGYEGGRNFQSLTGAGTWRPAERDERPDEQRTARSRIARARSARSTARRP